MLYMLLLNLGYFFRFSLLKKINKCKTNTTSSILPQLMTLFSSTLRVYFSTQRIAGLISSLSKNAICTAFLINEQVE